MAESTSRVSKLGQGFIGLAPLLLLGGWFAGGTAVHGFFQRPAPEPVAAAPNGAALFIKHCAYCHGEKGDGKGLAGLTPLARYFGRDKYKFTSTRKGDNGGIPTDDDLLYILRHGIEGTAMWGFQDRMTDEELRAVVAHLRALTRAGLAERYRLEAETNEEDPDWKAIAARVEREAVVGDPVPLPAFKPATPESVARGQQLFLNTAKTACASCHGATGRGDGPAVNDKKNDPPHQGGDGLPNKPRDLTTGRFKGGREKERLYPRILHGIPGTPMPPHTKLTPDEVQDLIDFVLSLKPDDKAAAKN
ncbi:MAG: cytochrome c [Gemmataceae bacterium]|nr:cytochrome c [Gemmataceae bacterium]